MGNALLEHANRSESTARLAEPT